MARKFRAKHANEVPLQRGVPRYCGPHKTGQAYSIFPTGTASAGKHRYHGLFGTPESRENYRRWLKELNLGGGTADGERPWLTIFEVWERWLDWARDMHLYEKDGEDTGTTSSYICAMKCVLDLYGNLPIQRFTPYNLNVCREAMCESGMARATINTYVSRIKRVWRRAAAWGFLDNEAYVAIERFEPLHRNEGGREIKRKLSVSEQDVAAVRKHLSPAVRAMIDVLTWSGCRSQEVRHMRTCDITDEDAAIPPSLRGQCWVYRPRRHKSEHHDKGRIVLLGPQAQSIIGPWLRPTEPDRYLFSPYETIAHCNKKRTKAGSAHQKRRSKATYNKLRPYAANSLWIAVRDACRAAGVEHWHPHRLRHLAATRLAQKYGVSVTQLLLGHTDAKTTLKYIDPGVLTADDRERYAVAIRAVSESG